LQTSPHPAETRLENPLTILLERDATFWVIIPNRFMIQLATYLHGLHSRPTGEISLKVIDIAVFIENLG
jgi:hypothetical protein